jgi:NADH-quinone oxidoreductase subunit N
MTSLTFAFGLSALHVALLALVAGALVLLGGARFLERSALTPFLVGAVSAAVAIGLGVSQAVLSHAARLAIEPWALIVAGATALIGLLSLPTAEMNDGRQRPEAAALILIGAVGGVVLATARSLLEIAVGVELISLAGATLIALSRGARPLEAAFKYFLLTAVTFAALLFGMALVFLGTGSLALPVVARVAAEAQPLVLCGLALVLVGLGFKLAVAPAHFGALDAYTAGAPGFVGFLMIVSKLGAAVALGRLATSAGASLSSVLVGVGLFTIGLGVVASFAQTDLRRLLAYSAVTHAGFLALAAGSGAEGAMAARFYVVGYGAAALLALAALAGSGTEPFAVASLRTRAMGPLRALSLLLALASLAGVPPTPGFWVKLAVLKAVWGAHGPWPTALAALGGVVGIIYYLRPAPDLLSQARRPGIAGAPLEKVAIVVLALAVAVLGVAPAVAW